MGSRPIAPHRYVAHMNNSNQSLTFVWEEKQSFQPGNIGRPSNGLTNFVRPFRRF